MAFPSIQPTTVALFYESTRATGPVDGGSTWAAQVDNTSGDRIFVLDVDISGLRQSSVEDLRMTDRVFKKALQDPINGLRNGTMSMTVPWHGTEAATAAASQVAETGLMRLLEHCFGGLSRHYSSAITLVNSDTSIDPTTTTDFDEGIPLWIEDDGDQNRLRFARVLTWDGTTATLDRAPYTGLATADDIEGAAAIYIDQDALVDPDDANANTVSVLVVRDGQVWEAVGGAFQVDSIEFARNEIPRISLSGNFSYVRPPGDGAPAEPTWTDTVQGDPGLVIGADLKLHIQDKGTTSSQTYEALSATFTPGVPRTPRNAVTENSDRNQGIAGFKTAPASTILEITVDIDTAHQDDWDTKQHKRVTLEQVGAPGKAWAIHGSDAVLMEPPQFSESEESVLMTLRYEFMEDPDLVSAATNKERARSKLLLVQG